MAQEDRTVVAFLALYTDRAAAATVLMDAMREVLPSHTVVCDSDDEQAKALVFSIDDYICGGLRIDYPIPWQDLEGPCATSWRWDEAIEVMRRHRAHLVVTIMGDAGDHLDRALLLSRILVACIRTHDAAGVYWGDGALVNAPEAFVEETMAADRDDPPVLLWIDFRVQFNDDNTLNIITAGLTPFGCMEIELLATRQKVQPALMVVARTSTILLQGEQIAHGDTIEYEGGERITTTHERSVWDRPGKVLRIHW